MRPLVRPFCSKPSAVHVPLVEYLFQRTSLLHENVFEGSRGLSCRLITCENPINISHSLDAWKKLCPGFFPGVIPMVLSAQDLTHQSIFDAVEKEIGKGSDNDLRPLSALESSHRKLFLMIDGMDDLYQRKQGKPGSDESIAFSSAGESLWELAFLGDQASGLVSAVLCGRSYYLPLLIGGGYGIPELHKEFPRVKGAPSLNETKFRHVHFE